MTFLPTESSLERTFGEAQLLQCNFSLASEAARFYHDVAWHTNGTKASCMHAGRQGTEQQQPGGMEVEP